MSLSMSGAIKCLAVLLVAVLCGCGGTGGITTDQGTGDAGTGAPGTGGPGGAGDTTTPGTVPATTVDTTAPVLASGSVNPDVVDIGGGTIGLSVTATDDVGVTTLQFTVTDPEGTEATVDGALAGSAGSAEYVSPSNDTGTDRNYTVTATATDAAGNEATAAVGEFIVRALKSVPTPW